MLLSLSYIFLIGLTLGGLMKRLKLPPLLGMLMAGVVLGPYGLNQIAPEILFIAKDLRQIALIIILTQAGLSLDLTDLKRVGRPALLMSFVPATFEMVAITLLGPLLLGLSLLDSAILGAVLAAVSPAVVVPRMLRLMHEGIGTQHRIPQMIMAGASIDDIYVIVIFSSLLGMAQGTGFETLRLVWVPLSLLVGAGVGVGVGLGLIHYFKRVHVRDTVKVLVLLGVSFMMVNLETFLEGILPFSGLLAIMAVGLTILEKYPVLAKRLASKFSKSWVGAELMLFVLVGSAVDLRYLTVAGFSAVALVLLGLVVRSVGVWLCQLNTPLTRNEKIFTAMAYWPKATVQAAIGSVPLALGLASGNSILAVAVVAILLTAPLGALAIDYGSKRLLSRDIHR